jgi:hypothetical protein
MAVRFRPRGNLVGGQRRDWYPSRRHHQQAANSEHCGGTKPRKLIHVSCLLLVLSKKDAR